MNVFEQLFKGLIRYIDQSNFDHCFNAKLQLQSPLLVTKVFMVKSDLNLCSEIYSLLCDCSDYGCQQFHGSSVCIQASW